MALQNVHKCASVVSFSLVNIGEKVVKMPVTGLILRPSTHHFYSFFPNFLLPHSTSFLGLVRSEKGPLHPHSGADPPQYGPSAWRRATPFSGPSSLRSAIASTPNSLDSGLILRPSLGRWSSTVTFSPPIHLIIPRSSGLFGRKGVGSANKMAFRAHSSPFRPSYWWIFNLFY